MITVREVVGLVRRTLWAPHTHTPEMQMLVGIKMWEHMKEVDGIRLGP